MANLASIKNRIKSIKSTEKITNAMQMVASSKVKKSEKKAKDGRPFTLQLVTMFADLVKQVGTVPPPDLQIKRALDNYHMLLTRRPIDTVGMLVITSNKGLAGAYNANVVKLTLKKIKEYNEQNIAVKLYVVGTKGIAMLKHKIEKLNAQIVMEYTDFIQEPNAGQAQIIVEDMAEALIKDKIDTIEIVVTTFKNMMSYNVDSFRLLPFEPDSADIIKKDEPESKYQTEITFEPSIYEVLQKVVPMVLTNTVYHCLLEATASELASRMTAMSAACKSANEMIEKLSIEYNKARQSAITNEIIEVVSGANAV